MASKVVAEPAKEQRKEQGREKIEWRGEDGREARRTPDREKRPRESPGRAERRHTSRHDRVIFFLTQKHAGPWSNEGACLTSADEDRRPVPSPCLVCLSERLGCSELGGQV